MDGFQKDKLQEELLLKIKELIELQKEANLKLESIKNSTGSK